jgi:hypothetical protein
LVIRHLSLVRVGMTSSFHVNAVSDGPQAASRRQHELLFHVEQCFQYMLYHHKITLGWTRGAKRLESRHG